MLKKIYIHSVPFVLPLTPLLAISATSEQLLKTAYPAYLIFVVCFLTLAACVSYFYSLSERTEKASTVKSALWYALIIATATGIVLALESLRGAIAYPSAFWGVLIFISLFGVTRICERRNLFFCKLGALFLTYLCLVLTGFEALGFAVISASVPYSFSMASIATAQSVVALLNARIPAPSDRAREPQTRKQRRERRVAEQTFAETRAYRLLVSTFLLLGPISLVTLAATPFLAGRFLLVALVFLPVRPILSDLLPQKEAIEIRADSALQVTSFSYLFFLSILLIRILPV